MYYNTTSTTGKKLKFAWQQSTSQTNIILKYFQDHESEKLGASEIWERLITEMKISSMTPLTSIRRSITDLHNAGTIIKSEEKKIGFYGRNEHLWFLGKGLFNYFD